MPTPTSAPQVDLAVRVEMCHAALQHLAVQLRVDLLHIKGLAFAPEWRSRGLGSDADVLVRPSQVARFVDALEAGPWERRSRFHTGSPFGHAQTYWHPHLGYADIHRFFPGMGRGDDVFDALWSESDTTTLAATGCPVPEQAAQALVWALNEARNSPAGDTKERVRDLQESDLGGAVVDLVGRTHAQVGWAAALGELPRVSAHRDHDLWHAVTHGTGRVKEWQARVKAEPSLPGKVRLVLRAPMVNVEHLTNTRGHKPAKAEIAREFIDRARRAGVELWRARRGHRA